MVDYLNNKRFEEVILLYQEAPSEHEDELVKMFDILISNIIASFNFAVDHEDAKQDCYLLIFRTLGNFDKEAGSAFNYFSTVIVNNLRLIYSKNKKYLEKLQEYEERQNDK